MNVQCRIIGSAMSIILLAACAKARPPKGPKFFKVARAASVPDGSWKVYVHFWYDQSSAGWEDTVVVTEERARYVIDDVLFAGAGAFNPSIRLSERLKFSEDQ